MRRVLFISLIIIALLKVAEAQGAEWKFIGGLTLLEGVEALAFYDTETVAYKSSGNIRVWIKEITQPEAKRVMKKEEKQIVERSAKKLASGYFPPYSLANLKTSFDEAVDIIAWEELANSSQIKARAKILFEINCKEKMIRSISVTVFKNAGGVASSQNPGEWSYISPESNGETLQRILCK